MKIKNEVGELKDRLETFFSHIGELSPIISRITEKFNEAVGSFETRVRQCSFFCLGWVSHPDLLTEKSGFFCA
jgi:hypothetical protein